MIPRYGIVPADKKGSSIMNAAYLTPAITLFHKDGSLDFESQEKLFNNLILEYLQRKYLPFPRIGRLITYTEMIITFWA